MFSLNKQVAVELKREAQNVKRSSSKHRMRLSSCSRMLNKLFLISFFRLFVCFVSCHTNFFPSPFVFSFLCRSFSLSASVSTFHTLSLDFLASFSFALASRFASDFRRNLMRGQLSKFIINPDDEIPSFQTVFSYEEISQCQSKSYLT